MVQKINPHQAPGCIRSFPPPYYVFSKDEILGSVPSISSEVLALNNDRNSAEFSHQVNFKRFKEDSGLVFSKTQSGFSNL